MRTTKLKPNELTPQPLPLGRFHWDREREELVAETSDFGPCREGWWWLGPLYNDACDLGIAIRSHRTGAIVRFYLHEEVKRDGELQYMVFRPMHQLGTVRRVVVFND
jgi:hypothetical protein